MSRLVLLSLLAVLFLVSCNRPSHEDDLEMIEDVMNGQANAWNKGDLEGYMRGYWMSDSLIFTGGKSISYGWQAALDRYVKSYPDKNAMGHLKFDDVQTKFTSPNAAYSVGQWTLHRSQDTLSGRFTLVWREVHGAWVIVADHSS